MLSIFLDLIDDASDKELFENVYNNYQKQMFYIANRILKDNQLSEDALQNTFLKIAVNIKVLRKLDENQTKYYLFISARNAALDIYKKRKKTNTVDIDAFYNLKDDSYSDTIEAFEDDDYIVHLLKKLPTKYTDVMYFKYSTDMNDMEIAKALDRNVNTVRQQYRRGKQKFAALYEKENNN